MQMRLLTVMLLLPAAASFMPPLSHSSGCGKKIGLECLRPPSLRGLPSQTSPAIAAKKAGEEEESNPSVYENLVRPLYFLGPLGFVLQILFLVAANQVSGPDNLEEYGRLGNAYIRENTDYDTMPIMERFAIQTRGQQIWYDNVLRDLKNGGPVKPPISTIAFREDLNG